MPLPSSCFKVRQDFIILILLILSWQLCPAQSRDIRFNRLTTDQGLLSSSALLAVQDYQGFMWFGSEEGLQRYDGYSFKTYLANEHDTTSLSSSYIQEILEDSRHNLWIGTLDGGLCWYDRAHDRFIRFQHDAANQKSLISNFVQVLYEDANETIYIGTAGNGVSAFKIPNRVTSELQFTNYPFPSAIALETNRWVGAIAETPQGLLLAINGSGVRRLNTSTGTFAPVLADSVDSRPQCLLYDSRERLWIGTWQSGLYVIDKRHGKIFHHQAGNKPGYLSHNQLYKLVEDKEGNIWIATDNGLNLLPHHKDPFQSAPFTTFKHDPFDNFSLLANSIKDVYIDRQNRLWVATYFGGINLYDKDLLQFRSFRSNGPGTPGLSSSNVFALAKDNSANLWVGTDGGGLNFAPGPLDQIRKEHFEKIPLARNGQSVDKIKCLETDASGNLWVGTWGDGLFKVNMKTRAYQHVPIEAFREDNLPVNEILAIEADEAGNLWLGTFGFGVLRYHVLSGAIQQFLRVRPDEHGLFKVNDLHVDKRGRVWVARDGGGLSFIEPQANTYTTVVAGALTQTLTVTTIMEDASGKLWLGTNASGLITYDPSTNKAASFQDASGLISNSVVGLLEASDSSVWVSTNNGLFSIEKSSGKIEHFTKSDGLHGNQFNNNAALRDEASGMLLFGGPEGLTAFHPNDIEVHSTTPPIVFTHFKIDNEDVPIGPDSPLAQNISLTEQIDLRYFQNSFSVEFAALQFDPASRVRYAYRLDDFTKKWIDLGLERKATFTALLPGTYTLRVKASMHGEPDSGEEAILRILIRPAWWQTIWFKVLSVAAFVLATVAFFRARVNYLQRQRAVLRKQVAEATEEIAKKNLELEGRMEEISARDSEIQAQNEELTAQNEQILTQRQSLEQAHENLKALNNHLEDLVHQRTAKLETTVRELDTVVSELDRFVYSASHDLSAPLKSVLGLVNIMRMETDPAKLRTYYDYIESSIKKLDSVIKSLVEFSRNTHHPVIVANVNVHEIAKDVVGELAFWPEAQHVKIINNIKPDDVVKSDPDRLKVILHNLIGNSIKYADQKKSTPTIWLDTYKDDDAFVLEVKDNGIGIEESKQENVFKMFFRGSDRSKGSGLGLFIVKEMVEKLKGTIVLKSEYSVGTSIQVRLPLHE